MTTTATKTAPAKTAPAAPAAPAAVPTIPPIAPWRLAECDSAERVAFLERLTQMIDALRTAPKGMEREDRAEFVETSKRARLNLIRVFPLVEAMHDRERFTLNVAVVVKTADGEKTAERRAVRLTDAVYARLSLYGRTMESVGLA